MTKQRGRPSLGQAALVTGLLGVGGWLASSALAPHDANASELPADPGNYTDTGLSDPGSIDVNQLANSVLSQVAQMRANGHDFSIGVAPQVSDQTQQNDIPAALRNPATSDSQSRSAWRQAAQRVADLPSPRVISRSTTPADTSTAPSSSQAQASNTDSTPVAPVRHRHRRRDSTGGGRMYPLGQTPVGSTDRRDDDQNGAAASTPAVAVQPGDGDGTRNPPLAGDAPQAGDVSDPASDSADQAAAGDPGGSAGADVPDIGFGPGDENSSSTDGGSQAAGDDPDGTGNGDIPEPPSGDSATPPSNVPINFTAPNGEVNPFYARYVADNNGDGDSRGTGQEPLTDIPDGATERARLGPNYKDSLDPGEIKDSDIPKTLLSRESSIEDLEGQVQQYLSQNTTTETQPGPEVVPEGEDALSLRGVSAMAAIIAQQLQEKAFKPIQARLGVMRELRLQRSVTGKSPFNTDPDSYLDPESDAAFSDSLFGAGAASAELTDPDSDAALGEVPVDELPAPPPMRPARPSQDPAELDPDAELQEPQLSDEQLAAEYDERAANGETGYVESQGSIGDFTDDPATEPLDDTTSSGDTTSPGDGTDNPADADGSDPSATDDGQDPTSGDPAGNDPSDTDPSSTDTSGIAPSDAGGESRSIGNIWGDPTSDSPGNGADDSTDTDGTDGSEASGTDPDTGLDGDSATTDDGDDSDIIGRLGSFISGGGLASELEWIANNVTSDEDPQEQAAENQQMQQALEQQYDLPGVGMPHEFVDGKPDYTSQNGMDLPDGSAPDDVTPVPDYTAQNGVDLPDGLPADGTDDSGSVDGLGTPNTYVDGEPDYTAQNGIDLPDDAPTDGTGSPGDSDAGTPTYVDGKPDYTAQNGMDMPDGSAPDDVDPDSSAAYGDPPTYVDGEPDYTADNGVDLPDDLPADGTDDSGSVDGLGTPNAYVDGEPDYTAQNGIDLPDDAPTDGTGSPGDVDGSDPDATDDGASADTGDTTDDIASTDTSPTADDQSVDSDATSDDDLSTDTDATDDSTSTDATDDDTSTDTDATDDSTSGDTDATDDGGGGDDSGGDDSGM